MKPKATLIPNSICAGMFVSFCVNPPNCSQQRQRRGRLFEVKNRPRANPVSGGLGVTGIAESSCESDEGCPMLV